MQIIVQSDGSLRCLYSEELDLRGLGQLTITRGSHVEPTTAGQWTADLAPVGGPLLGPYVNRSQALEAERQWLEQHWLTSP